MGGKSLVSVFFLFVSVNSRILVPDCQLQSEDTVFTAEPRDVEVTCGSNKVAIFPCQHSLGSDVILQWTINSTTYTLSNLPHNHIYNGTVLFVREIERQQNNTLYQCLLDVPHPKTPCVQRSKIARLIIRGCNAPDIKCTPYYDYKSHTLEAIFTNITKGNGKFNGKLASYEINYADSTSGSICGSEIIPATSCVAGTCSSMLEFSSEQSACFKNSSITVIVSVTNAKGGVFQSHPMKIDFVNKFIDVEFDEKVSSITLRFINQPKASKKFYSVHYDLTEVAPDCKTFSHQIEGYLYNSNLISLELEISMKDSAGFCFLVMVNNGTEKVNVRGIYKYGMKDGNLMVKYTTAMSSPERSIAFVTVTICAAYAILTLTILMLLHMKSSNVKKGDGSHKEAAAVTYEDSLQQIATTRSQSQRQQVTQLQEASLLEKAIDKSTAFFTLHYITEDCLMDKFATRIYPNYQAKDGYGYYEFTSSTELEEIESSLDIIVMDQDNMPEFSTLVSAIEKYRDRSVYVQSKSVKTKLIKDTRFLYCVHSEVLTAYSEEYEVTQPCKELEFLMENIPGYRNEWIRYIYFEFTKAEFIKSYQNIIMKKKTGELVGRPGVRHLVGALGRGSDIVKPPKLSEHPEWEHIFIQSRDTEEPLLPGTKYLFCAIMERVRETVFYNIYDVEETCYMAEFAKQKIPGFRPELGYGYYEFIQEEFLEPEKEVVLMDKHKKLYTGAGARFFCTRGGYDPDFLRENMCSPPNLGGTVWENIFIQSHSNRRVLLQGSKFLYFEYQTHQ